MVFLKLSKILDENRLEFDAKYKDDNLSFFINKDDFVNKVLSSGNPKETISSLKDLFSFQLKDKKIDADELFVNMDTLRIKQDDDSSFQITKVDPLVDRVSSDYQILVSYKKGGSELIMKDIADPQNKSDATANYIDDKALQDAIDNFKAIIKQGS